MKGCPHHEVIRLRTMVAVIVAAVALGATPGLAAAPVEAGKVYSGSDGEEVAVVPLAPRSEKKFIIRVKGTGSEFDGKVFTWIGRRKETGRGQGASGLEFDRIASDK